MPKIKILVEGYFKNISRTRCRAGSTVTLIQDDSKNILVDTGNPQDSVKIIKALKKQNLTTDKIDFVALTHFHPDHTGCNYLFSKARFIVPGVAFWDDVFERKLKYQKITPNIKLMATPGHTTDSCSVLVKTEQGIIAIVGDLFWSENDSKIKLLEKDCADKKLFYQNRKKILKIADWIIPGHGKMFKVEKAKFNLSF